MTNSALLFLELMAVLPCKHLNPASDQYSLRLWDKLPQIYGPKTTASLFSRSSGGQKFDISFNEPQSRYLRSHAPSGGPREESKNLFFASSDF